MNEKDPLDLTLLISTYISNQRASQLDRGLLKTPSREEVFLYMIASLSVIPFKKVIIYFELEPDLRHLEAEVVQFIGQKFPDGIVRPRRLLRLGDWKYALNSHGVLEEERPILYLGNDDHIFLDSSLVNLEHSVSMFKKLMVIYPHLGLHYSHFLESLACWFNVFYDDPVLNGYFDKEGQSSVQILSPYTLKRWFFDQTRDLSDDYLIRRAEDIPNRLPIVNSLHVRVKAELFRHFDGQSHVGLMEVLPPLSIPENFFTNLRVFSSNCRSINSDFVSTVENLKEDGWTFIDPFPQVHSSAFSYGADLDRGISNMPLFWRDYCRDVKSDISESFERDLSKRYREHLIGVSLNLSASQKTNAFKPTVRPQSSAVSLAGPVISLSKSRKDVENLLFVHKVPRVRRQVLAILVVHRALSHGCLFGISDELHVFKALQKSSVLGLYFLSHAVDGDIVGVNATHGPTTFLSFYKYSLDIDGIFSFRSGRPFNEYYDLYALELLSRYVDAQFILLIEQSFCASKWSISQVLAAVVDDLQILRAGFSSVVYSSKLLICNQEICVNSSAILTDVRFLRLAIKALGFDSDVEDHPSLVHRICAQVGQGDVGLRAKFKNQGQVYFGPLLSSHGYSVLTKAHL